MIKLLNRLTNTLLTLAGIAAGIGLIYTLKPEYFEFIFSALKLTESQVAAASTILAAITVFGSLSKYFKGIVNTQQTLHEVNTKRELSLQNERHEAELEKIKESRVEEIKLFSTILNDLIDTQNENQELNELILTSQVITAQRNIKSNLVTEEEKLKYRIFLDTINNRKGNNRIAPLLTEIEYEVDAEEPLNEEVPEDLLNVLEARLKGDK